MTIIGVKSLGERSVFNSKALPEVGVEVEVEVEEEGVCASISVSVSIFLCMSVCA